MNDFQKMYDPWSDPHLCLFPSTSRVLGSPVSLEDKIKSKTKNERLVGVRRHTGVPLFDTYNLSLLCILVGPRVTLLNTYIASRTKVLEPISRDENCDDVFSY